MLSLHIYESTLNSNDHCLSAVGYLQFTQQVVDMCLNGSRRNFQITPPILIDFRPPFSIA
jgi:hypothetical protein